MIKELKHPEDGKFATEAAIAALQDKVELFFEFKEPMLQNSKDAQVIVPDVCFCPS